MPHHEEGKIIDRTSLKLGKRILYHAGEVAYASVGIVQGLAVTGGAGVGLYEIANVVSQVDASITSTPYADVFAGFIPYGIVLGAALAIAGTALTYVRTADALKEFHRDFGMLSKKERRSKSAVPVNL